MRYILAVLALLFFALAPARAENQVTTDIVAQIQFNVKKELDKMYDARRYNAQVALDGLYEAIHATAGKQEPVWLKRPMPLRALEEMAFCLAGGATLPLGDLFESGLFKPTVKAQVMAVKCLPFPKSPSDELKAAVHPSVLTQTYIWLVMVKEGQSLQVGKKYNVTAYLKLANGTMGYLPWLVHIVWQGQPEIPGT